VVSPSGSEPSFEICQGSTASVTRGHTPSSGKVTIRRGLIVSDEWLSGPSRTVIPDFGETTGRERMLMAIMQPVRAVR